MDWRDALDRIRARHAEDRARSSARVGPARASTSSWSRRCSATTARGSRAGRGRCILTSQKWTSAIDARPAVPPRRRRRHERDPREAELLQAASGGGLRPEGLTVCDSGALLASCPAAWGIRDGIQQRTWDGARPRRWSRRADRRVPAREGRPQGRRPRGRGSGRRPREDGRDRRLPVRPGRPPLLHEVDRGRHALARDPRRGVPAPAAHVADLLEQPLPRLSAPGAGRDPQARPGRAHALPRLVHARPR